MVHLDIELFMYLVDDGLRNMSKYGGRNVIMEKVDNKDLEMNLKEVKV